MYDRNDNLPSLETRQKALQDLFKTAAPYDIGEKDSHPLHSLLDKMDNPPNPEGGRVDAATKVDGSKAVDTIHRYLEQIGAEEDPDVVHGNPLAGKDYATRRLTQSIARYQQVTGQDIGPLVSGAMGDMQRKSAMAAADVLGISRVALTKKASLLGVSPDEIIFMEMAASGLMSKVAQNLPLTTKESQFLEQMITVQDVACGLPDDPYMQDTVPEAVGNALHKQSSMAEVLIARDQEKANNQPPPEFASMAQGGPGSISPSDEENRPHKKERREQIHSIFGA